MAEIRLLQVDDEQSQRELLSGFLGKNGFCVTEAGSGEEALELYHSVCSPVALIDMKMPGMNGIELLTRLKEINPFIQIIVLTAFGTVESAVAAMRAGAYDYVTKPVENLDELLLKLRSAAERNRLIIDNEAMSERLSEVFPESDMLGESAVMRRLKEMVATVAPRDATILITGPSGTGKELVARMIHALSDRGQARLVAINCAAFPETLLESELFGYEKGAFTGASQSKQGRFELADGGTLFLDEIGEMTLSMQVKLLRVLDDHTIERLGSVKGRKLDIRLIAATNRNLESMIEEKRFREDLYYRLNVIRIDMPPLAERGGDILLLARHFLSRFARKIGRDIKGISAEAAALLSAYHWPGNVRELENVIERAVVLTRGESLSANDFAGISSREPAAGTGSVRTLAEVEKSAISSCLEANDWNIGSTAELLGIHRNTLRTKIKQYGIKQL